jgi:tetratricopeptide (TPR) repeat protein
MKKPYAICPALLLFLALACAQVAHGQKGMGLANFAKAEDLRKTKNHAEAVAEYDKAIKAEADNPIYYFNRGLCYVELKNAEKAKESFQKATQLRPDHFKAFEMLGRLADLAKDTDGAVANYDKASDQAPDKAQKVAYLVEAIKVLNRAGRTTDVGQHLAKGKALDAEHLELLYLEARNQNALGNHQAVIGSVPKIVAHPKHAARPANEMARFHYELGLAYFKTQQYQLAEPALKKADVGTFKPKVFEMTPEYYYLLANAYFKTFVLAKSEEYLATARAMRPNYKEANELATRLANVREDKTERMKTELDSIYKEKNPSKKQQRYCELCRYQFDAGEFAAAAASAEECLRLNQKNTSFIFYRAISLHRSGDLDKATYELDKLVQSPLLDAETKAMFHFALGMMYRDAKQPQLAAGYFKKANGTFEPAAKLELRNLLKGKGGDEEGEAKLD